MIENTPLPGGIASAPPHEFAEDDQPRPLREPYPVGVPLTRLYERLGPRYMLAWIGVAVAVAVAFPPTPATFMAWFKSISARQYLELVAISAGVVVIALPAGFLAVRADLATIHRWLRGARSSVDAFAVRAAAERFPRRAVGGAFGTGLACCPVAALLVARVIHFGFVGFVAVAFGGVICGIWASVLAYFVIELGLQPVLWDVAGHMPRGGPPASYQPTIGRNLFRAMLAIGLIGSCAAAVLAAPRGSESNLLQGMAASLVITTVVSAALTMLVVRTTAAPIRQLTEVTERVRAGDLSVRARPFSTNELGHLAESLNAMLDGLRDRAVLHEAFGSYVNPQVADRILQEGTVLGGTSWDATIMFVDICGFTEWSERVTPAAAVERLDEFFALLVPVVERNDGEVNKFVGDGLVAVFGRPGSTPGAADNALRTAIEMVDTVAERFGTTLKIGVGINSGPIVAGTVGGGGRFEYMLIGDPVNVASRVERLTRTTGDTVLLTEATLERLAQPPAGLERRGEIRVKGKSEPLKIYALS